MTKKELEQIKTVQKQKRNLRRMFLDALSSFTLDVNSIERVNRMNGVETTDEMREDALKRYPVLTENGYFIKPIKDDKALEYTSHKIIYAMRATENSYRGYGRTDGKFEHGLDDDDIVIDDIDDSKMATINLISFMHRFGYKRIVFTDRSTRCLNTLSNLAEFRAKMVGANRNIEYGYHAGIIIDIEDVDLGLCIEWMCSEEKRNLIKKNAEWDRPTKQEDLDAIEKKYNELNVVE